MANQKQYLDQEGLERLVEYINNALRNKANIGDIPEDVAKKADLINLATRDELREYIDVDELNAELTDVVREGDINDVVREQELSEALDNIKTSIATVYHYRGNVQNLEELQAIENPAIGDVYNILDTGMNAGWTGEVWDYFGSITDLTDYLTKDEVNAITIPVVDSILYGGSVAAISDMSGLQTMLANDKPKVEIIINEDLDASENILVPTGKEVVLNLNGNRINMGNKAFEVRGQLVIDGDGNIDSSRWGINAQGSNAMVTLNSGYLMAGESPMTIQGGAKFIMNGGTLEGVDNCPLMGQGTAGNGNTEMVINGGKLIAHITSAGYTACGIYMPNNGKLVMNGGQVISDGAGLVMRAGEVELNGGAIIANGATGSTGMVGDSRVVVGPYAVVYDESAKYPGATAGEFKLTIGKDMVLQGTDGDISTLLSAGATANIIDNR